MWKEKDFILLKIKKNNIVEYQIYHFLNNKFKQYGSYGYEPPKGHFCEVWAKSIPKNVFRGDVI